MLEKKIKILLDLFIFGKKIIVANTRGIITGKFDENTYYVKLHGKDNEYLVHKDCFTTLAEE